MGTQTYCTSMRALLWPVTCLYLCLQTNNLRRQNHTCGGCAHVYTVLNHHLGKPSFEAIRTFRSDFCSHYLRRTQFLCLLCCRSASLLGCRFVGDRFTTRSGRSARKVKSRDLPLQQCECNDTLTLGHSDSFASCLLYTSPSPRDRTRSRMPSSA